MRLRFISLIAFLVLSTSGCANCLLHSMIDFFPDAYSGGGTTADEKHEDLDRTLEFSQQAH
jgi:hypothetical protein